MRSTFLALLLLALPAHAATIEQFGGACDGSDTALAVNAAETALQYSSDHVLSFQACQYTFKQPPNPIVFGLHIVGQDKVGTVLEAAFNGGSLLYFTGAWQSGGGVSDLSLYSPSGFAPNYALVLKGNATTQPDEWVGRNLYITGPGLWWTDILVDGTARPSPQGNREPTFENVSAFNAKAATVVFSGVDGIKMVGGGIYQGAGNYAATGIWITGGTAANQQSAQVDLFGVVNNGTLNVTNTPISVRRLGGERGSLATDAASVVEEWP